MSALTTVVARVLYGLPFIVFGLNHFMKTAQMANYVPAWLPASTLWVYLTGLVLIAGGVTLITNRFARTGSLALAAFLLVTTLTVHVPKMASSMPDMVAVLKNTALLGAALAFAGILLDKKKPTV